MLRVEGIRAGYGRVDVLHGIDLEVPAGRIVSLVGANGAGKTTLLRCISGVHPAAAGRVAFDGADVSRLSAARRVRLGLSQVPEGRLVFAPMSVQENLELGAYTQPASAVRERMDEVFALFPALAERRALQAGALSGGEQQMLAIGRALMCKPRLLLLDEPSLGLAPIVVQFIFERLRALNRAGLSVLVVEQNASLALAMADTGYVMETGRVVARGSGRELLADPAVQAAYLGL
jgi:branched-chain amino acid transport system ATP-binding protein